MTQRSNNGSKRMLVVARWPLGGIRTYMRYMFNHFPSRFSLTILAVSTQEDEALIRDAEMYNARLILATTESMPGFIWEVFKELRKRDYDLIISQGFVSAVAVFFGNVLNKLPTIVTIHGIVEPQYLEGRLLLLKRWMLMRVLGSATVLYGVSQDILEHLYEEFPLLRSSGPLPLVILNGIESTMFDQLPAEPIDLRTTLQISSDVIMFGFYGRFMPQKGFDLIIDAVDVLRQRRPDAKFVIVAVGSGDYIREYQLLIRKKEISSFFYFLPFQPMVHHLYTQVDAILMPSRWEACPLLPMEVLCMGVPLIASNCIGTREVIFGTPAYVIEPENIEQLIQKMNDCLDDQNTSVFKDFLPLARKRFDVSHSAQRLIKFVDQLLNKNE